MLMSAGGGSGESRERGVRYTTLDQGTAVELRVLLVCRALCTYDRRHMHMGPSVYVLVGAAAAALPSQDEARRCNNRILHIRQHSVVRGGSFSKDAQHFLQQVSQSASHSHSYTVSQSVSQPQLVGFSNFACNPVSLLCGVI